MTHRVGGRTWAYSRKASSCLRDFNEARGVAAMVCCCTCCLFGVRMLMRTQCMVTMRSTAVRQACCAAGKLCIVCLLMRDATHMRIRFLHVELNRMANTRRQSFSHHHKWVTRPHPAWLGKWTGPDIPYGARQYKQTCWDSIVYSNL